MAAAVALALVAGCADTLGFLNYDTFAGLMTGNTVLLGLSLARQHFPHAALYAAVLAAFWCGLLASRTALRLGSPARLPIAGTLAMVVLCNFLSTRWAAPALAFGMGLQNAAATRFAGVTLNTVFLTGDLQKLADGLLSHLLPRSAAEPVRPQELATLAMVWAGYLAGALLGAVSQLSLGTPFLVPAALLASVLLSGWLWR